jgi:hypothetical protein
VLRRFDTGSTTLLAKWYLGQEKVKALRYFPTLTINLAGFNQDLGDTIVCQIKSGSLGNYQAKRKKEGYSDAYVDRQIEAARAMIHMFSVSRQAGGLDQDRAYQGV